MRKVYRVEADTPLIISVKGKTCIIMDTGATATIGLAVRYSANAKNEELGQVTRKFKVTSPDFFEYLTLTSAVATNVDVLVSEVNLSVNEIDGSNLNATISPASLPLPTTVSNTVAVSVATTLPVAVQGTVPVSVAGTVQTSQGNTNGNPLYVTGNFAALPVAPAIDMPNSQINATAVASTIVPASATRSALRLLNVGSESVAIGKTGITWATRVIVLDAGEYYEETASANLAWVCICDTAKSTTINVMEVKL